MGILSGFRIGAGLALAAVITVGWAFCEEASAQTRIGSNAGITVPATRD